jgi:hypothetical protein
VELQQDHIFLASLSPYPFRFVCGCVCVVISMPVNLTNVLPKYGTLLLIHAVNVSGLKILSCWRLISSGIWHCVVELVVFDVSTERCTFDTSEPLALRHSAISQKTSVISNTAVRTSVSVGSFLVYELRIKSAYSRLQHGAWRLHSVPVVLHAQCSADSLFHSFSVNAYLISYTTSS